MSLVTQQKAKKNIAAATMPNHLVKPNFSSFDLKPISTAQDPLPSHCVIEPSLPTAGRLSSDAYTYTLSYTCTHTYIHVYTYTHIHIHIYTYIHIYIYTYIHISTYTCKYWFIYIYMYARAKVSEPTHRSHNLRKFECFKRFAAGERDISMRQ